MNDEKSNDKRTGSNYCGNIDKLKATGYLIGNTLHTVLNYLTGVRGYVDMLLSEKDMGACKRKPLEAIERSERKSSDALIRLSDFCKISREEIELIQVHEAIENTLNLTWPLIRYADITISKFFGENIPHITASREQLQEALTIIMINSFVAMEEQGVLTIRTNYLKEETAVTIVISGTDKSGKGKSALGLSSVYDIIDRHDGNMDVKSIEGKGTTYTIKMPVILTK
ncbi:MAG: hypothetical protein ABH843_02365 [Candidatus Omnitrophota bacterium]